MFRLAFSSCTFSFANPARIIRAASTNEESNDLGGSGLGSGSNMTVFGGKTVLYVGPHSL